MKYQELDDHKDKSEKEYEDIIVQIEYQRIKSKAEWINQALSVFLFFVGLIVYCWSKEVFAGGEHVTTLGATAVILILINMQAWPIFIHEWHNQTPVRELPTQKMRVEQFINSIDLILEFCTGLMK